MAVHYVLTGDGLELPIVDITNPVFHADDANQAALVEDFVRSAPDPWLARVLRRLALPILLSGSRIGAEIRRSEGTYLSGMGTYFMKLGPSQLGAWAKPIDRKIAQSLPALAVRWRLRDMAELLAIAMDGSTRTIRLVNIGGGPAMDSLNAILLRNSLGRAIEICVLDSDASGPAFGARALESWKRPGAPLDGVDVSFRHLPYDWNDPGSLASAIDGDVDVIVSSEGALFEYGTDDAIGRNLEILRPRALAVVGSVTRADEPMQVMKRRSAAATIPRGLDAFRVLAKKSGFEIDRVIERPFSDHVLLRAT
jgi:hypothetical protein